MVVRCPCFRASNGQAPLLQREPQGNDKEYHERIHQLLFRSATRILHFQQTCPGRLAALSRDYSARNPTSAAKLKCCYDILSSRSIRNGFTDLLTIVEC
jgi:hypothetical protein